MNSSMTHPEEPAAKPRKGWASRFAGVWKDSRSAEDPRCQNCKHI